MSEAIKERIRDLATKLAGESDDKGVVTLNDTVYVDNLPEGIDKEVLKALRSYDLDFSAAVGLATAESAVDYLKANKKSDLNRFYGSATTFGSGSVAATYDQNYTKHIPSMKAGVPAKLEEAKGRITLKGDVTVAKRNTKQFSTVVNYIEELATSISD